MNGVVRVRLCLRKLMMIFAVVCVVGTNATSMNYQGVENGVFEEIGQNVLPVAQGVQHYASTAVQYVQDYMRETKPVTRASYAVSLAVLGGISYSVANSTSPFWVIPMAYAIDFLTYKFHVAGAVNNNPARELPDREIDRMLTEKYNQVHDHITIWGTGQSVFRYMLAAKPVARGAYLLSLMTLYAYGCRSHEDFIKFILPMAYLVDLVANGAYGAYCRLTMPALFYLEMDNFEVVVAGLQDMCQAACPTQYRPEQLRRMIHQHFYPEIIVQDGEYNVNEDPFSWQWGKISNRIRLLRANNPVTIYNSVNSAGIETKYNPLHQVQ